MATNIWIVPVLSALISGVFSTELLPEKYLKPKDFNYHPITDVGIPAALRKALKTSDSYAILSKKRPREGREFPPQSVVIYPTPHSSVISRKFVETNEISKYDDPYANVPKNYAFSYIVKDQHSGDDFSHSQAHNGKATRGIYRVKLPDGRTQVVSYTADHKGYRADVQYEDDLVSKPLIHSVQSVVEKPVRHSGTVNQKYQAGHVPVGNSKVSPEVVYTVTASPSNYVPSPAGDAPVQYLAENTPLNLVVKSTLAPHYYQPHYVSTTVAPYVQQQYATSTAAPQFLPQRLLASTPLFPVEDGSANTVSPEYHQGHYPNIQSVSSTVSPEHAVIVTPRPAYISAIRKSESQQSAPVYYKLL